MGLKAALVMKVHVVMINLRPLLTENLKLSIFATTLNKCDCNLFEFVERMKTKSVCVPGKVESFFLEVSYLQFSEKELIQTMQLHKAFLATCSSHKARIARATYPLQPSLRWMHSFFHVMSMTMLCLIAWWKCYL